MSKEKIIELTDDYREEVEVAVAELALAMEMIDQLLGGDKLRTTQACLADLPGLCRKYDIDLYHENDLRQIRCVVYDQLEEAKQKLDEYEELLLYLNEWARE